MKVLALRGPWPSLGPQGQGWAEAFAAQLAPWLDVQVGTGEGCQAVAAPLLPVRAFFGPKRLILDTRPWPTRWLEETLRPKERARYHLQLAMADHIICESAVERDGIIGALFALGLVWPSSYLRDPCLGRLVICAQNGMKGLVDALSHPPTTDRRRRMSTVLRKGLLSLI
jgi:hypothetical protein